MLKHGWEHEVEIASVGTFFKRFICKEESKGNKVEEGIELKGCLIMENTRECVNAHRICDLFSKCHYIEKMHA